MDKDVLPFRAMHKKAKSHDLAFCFLGKREGAWKDAFVFL